VTSILRVQRFTSFFLGIHHQLPHGGHVTRVVDSKQRRFWIDLPPQQPARRRNYLMQEHEQALAAVLKELEQKTDAISCMERERETGDHGRFASHSPAVDTMQDSRRNSGHHAVEHVQWFLHYVLSHFLNHQTTARFHATRRKKGLSAEHTTCLDIWHRA
jgi:hypothetical protein